MVFSVTEFETARPRLSLNGDWSFSYDPEERGFQENWFRLDKKFPENISVPGCSQAHEYASAGEHTRQTDVDLPEHSYTIMLKYGSLAPSWYQRRFELPREWNGKPVHLRVGGVKPAAQFWINGHDLGETLSSRSPIACDLTPHLRWGEENVLTARLHWSDIQLSGVFDILHAWSGFYRHAWLESAPTLRLKDIHVRTSIAPRAAIVNFEIEGDTPKNGELVCEIIGLNDGLEYSATARIEESSGKLKIEMPGAALWSTQSPQLYLATLKLHDGETLSDEGSVRFGLREIKTDGFQVLLNGDPIFLRGGCDDHVYPETVCPPADKYFFRERLAKAKKYGFNYTKSAAEIFTREYLEAADELGFLVCIEMPFGVQNELRAARESPTPELKELWQRELVNIVQSTRAHPSVVIYSMASELPINKESDAAYQTFSRDLPALTRKHHPSALIFDVTCGFCGASETKFGPRDTDLIEDDLSNAFSLTPLTGRLPVPDEVEKPFLLHEWNWTTSLPHPDVVTRYETSPLAPVQIPEMIEAARANGLLDELPLMAQRSRLLKHALRKDAYEQAFAHPKIAGFHGWLLHDFCFAPEGVFNEWWEEPDDLPADEFRCYNDETVLVIDDHNRRSFFYDEPLELGMIVAHFGVKDLENATLHWRLRKGETVVSQSTLAVGKVPRGERTVIKSLKVSPVVGEFPTRMEFECELREGDSRVSTNHWPLWFFPKVEEASADGTLISRKLGEKELQHLQDGGRMLLLSNGVLPAGPSYMYRTAPYNMGHSGNMGTVVETHPALGDFPHKGWCDFCFIPMIQNICPMLLASFAPTKIHPIIRCIGHQVTMRDQAYLWEARVGDGVLLACSLSLDTPDPAAQYLKSALIAYLSGDEVKPQTTIAIQQLQEACAKPQLS